MPELRRTLRSKPTVSASANQRTEVMSVLPEMTVRYVRVAARESRCEGDGPASTLMPDLPDQDSVGRSLQQTRLASLSPDASAAIPRAVACSSPSPVPPWHGRGGGRSAPGFAALGYAGLKRRWPLLALGFAAIAVGVCAAWVYGEPALAAGPAEGSFSVESQSAEPLDAGLGADFDGALGLSPPSAATVEGEVSEERAARLVLRGRRREALRIYRQLELSAPHSPGIAAMVEVLSHDKERP